MVSRLPILGCSLHILYFADIGSYKPRILITVSQDLIISPLTIRYDRMSRRWPLVDQGTIKWPDDHCMPWLSLDDQRTTTWPDNHWVTIDPLMTTWPLDYQMTTCDLETTGWQADHKNHLSNLFVLLPMPPFFFPLHPILFPLFIIVNKILLHYCKSSIHGESAPYNMMYVGLHHVHGCVRAFCDHVNWQILGWYFHPKNGIIAIICESTWYECNKINFSKIFIGLWQFLSYN